MIFYKCTLNKYTLKNLTDKHDEHWNANDEMLKEICMRVDNVEALGEMYNSLLDRIILIEEKLNINITILMIMKTIIIIKMNYLAISKKRKCRR